MKISWVIVLMGSIGSSSKYVLSNSNQNSTFQDFLEADLTNIEWKSLFSAVILVLVVNSTIYSALGVVYTHKYVRMHVCTCVRTSSCAYICRLEAWVMLRYSVCTYVRKYVCGDLHSMPLRTTIDEAESTLLSSFSLSLLFLSLSNHQRKTRKIWRQ